ncbi:MAG TPA: sensor domain-containing diguanylate cyclase, partial [Clostridia bacterium]
FEYTLIKVLEIVLVVILLSTMIYGHYFYFIALIPIVSICVTRGFSISLPYLCISFAAQALMFFLSKNNLGILQEYEANRHNPAFSILLVIVYITFLLFLRLLGVFYNQFRQSEQDNQNLVAQLGIKYAQLEQARIEKQEQFDKLKEVNLQLEDSNKRLTSSLAEFFTLQQISQAISSIFDMDELLQFVNDIIIGVMGVSTSNIALYSGGGDRLKVQVSNILNKRDLAILTDNINTPALKDAIAEGRTIINNAVDPEKYDFTRGRNVRSFLCVPLKIKDKTHGFVLIEHSIPDAFDADNVRLLEIITQQVSIAIDNARLYEQLQEYANTDGLTQVYNRIYFQKRLKEELDRAEQKGYAVSVILYDIDDFKLFNDSYGHLFGDVVLKSIARTVKESVRKDDLVARFGGEEFIILLPHTGTKRAYEKAEELRKLISSLTIEDNNITASVTVSMGISTFPTLANTDSSLISSADNALYEAKRSGKNCVKIAPCVKRQMEAGSL